MVYPKKSTCEKKVIHSCVEFISDHGKYWDLTKNDHHFRDSIIKIHFVTDPIIWSFVILFETNFCILIKTSPRSVSMGPIDNVQIMGNGSDDSKIFQSFLDSLYATEFNGNNIIM